jgi:hypothetical protein
LRWYKAAVIKDCSDRRLRLGLRRGGTLFIGCIISERRMTFVVGGTWRMRRLMGSSVLEYRSEYPHHVPGTQINMLCSYYLAGYRCS